MPETLLDNHNVQLELEELYKSSSLASRFFDNLAARTYNTKTTQLARLQQVLSATSAGEEEILQKILMSLHSLGIGTYITQESTGQAHFNWTEGLIQVGQAAQEAARSQPLKQKLITTQSQPAEVPSRQVPDEWHFKSLDHAKTKSLLAAVPIETRRQFASRHKLASPSASGWYKEHLFLFCAEFGIEPVWNPSTPGPAQPLDTQSAPRAASTSQILPPPQVRNERPTSPSTQPRPTISSSPSLYNFCTQCGAPRPATGVFCGECGASLKRS